MKKENLFLGLLISSSVAAAASGAFVAAPAVALVALGYAAAPAMARPDDIAAAWRHIAKYDHDAAEERESAARSSFSLPLAVSGVVISSLLSAGSRTADGYIKQEEHATSNPITTALPAYATSNESVEIVSAVTESTGLTVAGKTTIGVIQDSTVNPANASSVEELATKKQAESKAQSDNTDSQDQNYRDTLGAIGGGAAGVCGVAVALVAKRAIKKRRDARNAYRVPAAGNISYDRDDVERAIMEKPTVEPAIVAKSEELVSPV